MRTTRAARAALLQGFMTGKTPPGEPVKVVRDGAANKVEGLVVRRRKSVLFIPRYLLIGESVEIFNRKEGE